MRRTDEIRFCLLVEAGPGSAGLERTALALKTVSAASLIIAPAGEHVLTEAVAKPVVDLAQSKGVAALISSDVVLARALDADGVHLPWSKEPQAGYAAAREALGASFIVGADAGRSRHDAMMLGEAGADYVGFGIPGHVEDRAAARVRQLDLIAWWAEIFEVPVIAFDVETAEEANDLAEAGADFIAVRIAPDGGDLERWLHDVSAAIRVPTQVG
jgi:thiamine-phosphate pyrophosphorylase